MIGRNGGLGKVETRAGRRGGPEKRKVQEVTLLDGESTPPEEGEILLQEEQEETGAGVAELADLLRERDDEIARLQEQVKRTAADFENFRRRQEADRLRQLGLIKEDLFRSLLPVVDHLERAATAARAGAGVESLVQGVELVLRDTRRILEGHGVEAIEAEGQPFDPNLHEAVMTDDRDDVPDETVIQELQRGYRIGDRVLRPSMVKVARNAT